MDRKATTITLLMVLSVVGFWASGRLQKVWGSVFGEDVKRAKKKG